MRQVLGHLTFSDPDPKEEDGNDGDGDSVRRFRFGMTSSVSATLSSERY